MRTVHLQLLELDNNQSLLACRMHELAENRPHGSAERKRLCHFKHCPACSSKDMGHQSFGVTDAQALLMRTACGAPRRMDELPALWS